jgi:hypothetical protein
MSPSSKTATNHSAIRKPWLLAGALLVAALAILAWKHFARTDATARPTAAAIIRYQPRLDLETSGKADATELLEPWTGDASLEEIRRIWDRIGYRNIELIDTRLGTDKLDLVERFGLLLRKAFLYHYEGEPKRAYAVLNEARALAESDQALAEQMLYSVVFFQGVSALRRGETENCILCRGESSCILPIAPTAVHTNPEGSRLAIGHFLEYLERFPDDLGVKWLLNLAHMTLGEHPRQVDPRFLISLDRFANSEFDIGRFRDVGHLVGVNRFNQAGGAIMDDFDNDGLLDVVITNFDPGGAMAYFRNTGQGAFADLAVAAGISDQLGGEYCVQTDYNNDGLMDVFIVRGSWVPYPIRPTLLTNNGDGTFTDVTREAGLLHAVNSGSASWADYDNDGLLDLFICCERQPTRLYHNLGNGAFEDVAAAAGLDPNGRNYCTGSAWIDYDNDGYPDLFLNYFQGDRGGQLFSNNRDGTFIDVTNNMNLNGPVQGYSCWAWDYDNDGWLDIFANSYDRSLGDMVAGLVGQPHGRHSSRLYHNEQGREFEDQTRQAGLDMVFATMGSNFGDFDNDGFLDMYLGTGEPSLEFLDPNRMFKNVGGQRFADITGSSGTGHLQKGHGVACGDWDRDGDVDLFIEMGGAIPGDRYHNVLFQNPGQGNHWLTVKVIGRKSNRAALGARIKIVTAGDDPQTIRRHVSSGSSFGANPLEQTVGLGSASRIAILEIHWPTSGTTQVFRDIAADQSVAVLECADQYRVLDRQPVVIPVER